MKKSTCISFIFVLILLNFLAKCLYAENYNATPVSPFPVKVTPNYFTVTRQFIFFTIGSKGYVAIPNAIGITSPGKFFEYNPSPFPGKWTRKGDHPGLSFQSPSFVVNGRAIVVSGNIVWEYDPIKDIWTRKNDIPGFDKRAGFGFSIRGKGYIGGGFYNGRRFWEYDISNDLWSEKQNHPILSNVTDVKTSDIEIFPFVIGDNAYLVGTNINFYVYDSDKDKWFNNGYVDSTYGIGLAINGKGYLFNAHSKLYELDRVSETWIQKETFPNIKMCYPVGFSILGNAYIGLGGLMDNNRCTLDTVSNFWKIIFDDKISRYYVQMINVDDVGRLYINGVLKYVSKWGFLGTEPNWVEIGHHPGDSGIIDINNDLIDGKNELKFELWNAPKYGGAAINIVVKQNDNVIYSDSYLKEDSTEGIKYVNTYVINTTSSSLSTPNESNTCKAPNSLSFDDDFTPTCIQKWKMAIYKQGVLPDINELINFQDKNIDYLFKISDVFVSAGVVASSVRNLINTINIASDQNITVDAYSKIMKTSNYYQSFVLSYFVNGNENIDISKIWLSMILSAMAGDPSMAFAQETYNILIRMVTIWNLKDLKKMKQESQIGERYLTEFYNSGADTRKLAAKYSLPPNALEMDIVKIIANKYWEVEEGGIIFKDYDIRNVLNRINNSENYVNQQLNNLKPAFFKDDQLQ